MPSGYNALAARPQNRLAYPGQDVVNAFTQGLGPMLYGAAKGTAATIAGLPGDIEQLARQLLLSGAAPDSYTAKNMAAQALLPTSDRVRAMLPSLSSFGAGPQAQYTENIAASLGQNVVGNLVAPKVLPAVIRAGQDLPVGASIKAVGETYPQAEAMRLAQQRAALPVEQSGLGLPATNTAMDRAKAMGFNTDAYHATNANNITKFDLGKSNRGEGVSVALTPENAQAYGNITYPLKVDQQKIFDPTNKDQLGELKSYVENLIAQQKPYDKNSLSFYPFTPKKVLENLSNPQTGAYYLENDIISKSLKDLGYSGSVGMESGQSQLKMFNPENIRSQFAAFDPFRRTAATAAAMGVAAPDLLAAPLSVADQIDNINEVLKKKRKK